jgi:hypothetical protein
MEQKLHKQGFGLIMGLAIQFLLGMYINLFVAYPENQDARQYWEFTKHSPVVMLHLLFGTLLLVGAVAFVVRSYKNNVPSYRLPSVLGLLSLLLAWATGDIFVTSQQDIFSYLMALGFLFGVLSYAWGISRKSE